MSASLTALAGWGRQARPGRPGRAEQRPRGACVRTFFTTIKADGCGRPPAAAALAPGNSNPWSEPGSCTRGTSRITSRIPPGSPRWQGSWQPECPVQARWQAHWQPPAGSGRESCPRACGQDSERGAGKTMGKTNRAAEAASCALAVVVCRPPAGHRRRARTASPEGGQLCGPTWLVARVRSP